MNDTAIKNYCIWARAELLNEVENRMQRYGIVEEGAEPADVFGSAGKRDIAKRKVFGELADQYADLIILTEDDPRDENPKDIACQIKEGIQNTPSVFVEDRYEAIRQAIDNASDGDVILILGKGDEPFMYHTEGRVPWTGDNNCARECLAQAGYTKE